MSTPRNVPHTALPASLALLALVLLPGCSDISRVFAPPPVPVAVVKHPPAPPPARPPAPAQSRPAPVPPAEPVVSQPLGTSAPPAAAGPDVVLTGMSQPALVRLLGQPAARSPTGQGERWTYRSGRCQVEVFIFPDVARGEPAVLDQRVTDDTPGPDAAQACLRRMRDDHAI